MQSIIFVVLGIWAFFCLWLFLREFLWGWTLLSVKVLPMELNDNQKVIGRVLELLDEAEEKIELYDDGNSMGASLYNNDEFINALDNKLKENPSFQVICLFNQDDPLAFKEKFAKHEQVAIFVRADGTRPDDMHYKIIDEKKAYLSSHKLNADERSFNIVDGSCAPKRHQKRLFDIYRQDRTDFKEWGEPDV